MSMYNLIKYTDVSWRTSESLRQYYKDEPALDDKNNIIDFPANNNNSILLRFKQQQMRRFFL